MGLDPKHPDHPPYAHDFYWLGYVVSEDEYTLLWARLESNPWCRAARFARHLTHKLVDLADDLVRFAEKRQAERILGRKLVERAW